MKTQMGSKLLLAVLLLLTCNAPLYGVEATEWKPVEEEDCKKIAKQDLGTALNGAGGVVYVVNGAFSDEYTKSFDVRIELCVDTKNNDKMFLKWNGEFLAKIDKEGVLTLNSKLEKLSKNSKVIVFPFDFEGTRPGGLSAFKDPKLKIPQYDCGILDKNVVSKHSLKIVYLDTKSEEKR